MLRALLPLSRPVSGREAAKLARLSQTPALRALDDLVTLGVLRRTETPSQHLYEVNRMHQLVREGLGPLFRAERERIGRVLEALRTVLGQDANRIASAAVFGSAARGQDRPGSRTCWSMVRRGHAKSVDPAQALRYRTVGESLRPM